MSVIEAPHFLGSKDLTKKQARQVHRMQSYSQLYIQEEKQGHIVQIEKLLTSFSRVLPPDTSTQTVFILIMMAKGL